MLTNIQIEIPDNQWEDCGVEEPKSRLLSTVTVNGLHMHFEAIEVKDVCINDCSRWDCQRAAQDEMEDHFVSLSSAFEPDRAYNTTEINGRTYVIFACPFC